MTALLRVRDTTCNDTDELFKALYDFNEDAATVAAEFMAVVDDLVRGLKGSSDATNPNVTSVTRPVTNNLFSRVARMQQEGRPVISLCVGQPAWSPHPAALKRLEQWAGSSPLLGYTPSTGLPSLREAIASRYANQGRLWASASSVIVTASAKLALHNVGP